MRVQSIWLFCGLIESCRYLAAMNLFKIVRCKFVLFFEWRKRIICVGMALHKNAKASLMWWFTWRINCVLKGRETGRFIGRMTSGGLRFFGTQNGGEKGGNADAILCVGLEWKRHYGGESDRRFSDKRKRTLSRFFERNKVTGWLWIYRWLLACGYG